MWNSMLPALSQRARIIAYDGSPFHPSLKAFLKFLDEQGCVWEAIYCIFTLSIYAGPQFLVQVHGFWLRYKRKELILVCFHTSCTTT
jgi:hypothetical protein